MGRMGTTTPWPTSTLEDYFTPENLTGLGQVQVVTATFSAAGL